MYHYLQPDVRVTTRQGVPALTRRGSPVAHPLTVAEALALSFLGAMGEPAQAAAACAACLPDRGGSRWVGRVVHRYGPYLGDGPARPLDTRWLQQVDFPRLERTPTSRRAAAPSTVIWLVTLACNRRCPYCFYDVSPHAADCMQSPEDASLPREAVLDLIAQMAEVGTCDLVLTGGEPLLRRDLIEIIAAASRARIRTQLVSKYPITRPLARALAESGLSRITYSLDAAQPKVANALAGARGFLTQARAAIEALLAHGLALDVNAVVTALNRDHLDDLAAWLIELGVPKLALSPYALPQPTRPAALKLVPPAMDLERELERLRDRFGHRLVIEAGAGADAPVPGSACDAVCEVGFHDLHVLPDGRVTRCRYLPEDASLIIGSLREQSLMEIWDGPALHALTWPDRGRYRGTGCANCGGFTNCNNRGRCYLSARTVNGQPFSPDEYCLHR